MKRMAGSKRYTEEDKIKYVKRYLKAEGLTMQDFIRYYGLSQQFYKWLDLYREEAMR